MKNVEKFAITNPPNNAVFKLFRNTSLRIKPGRPPGTGDSVQILNDLRIFVTSLCSLILATAKKELKINFFIEQH